jgi:hypothetical protein
MGHKQEASTGKALEIEVSVPPEEAVKTIRRHFDL